MDLLAPPQRLSLYKINEIKNDDESQTFEINSNNSENTIKKECEIESSDVREHAV